MADTPQSGSTLLLDEYFAAGDDRFVEELRAVSSAKKLAALVDRWKRDPRPWARRQVLAYLDRPLDRPGHEVVVKRLFKHYESPGDDEVMAGFMVAFDRLVRRVRKSRYEYDHRTRQATQFETLAIPRNTIPKQEGKNRGLSPLLDQTRGTVPFFQTDGKRGQSPAACSATAPATTCAGGRGDTFAAWASSGRSTTPTPPPRSSDSTPTPTWRPGRTCWTVGA